MCDTIITHSLLCRSFTKETKASVQYCINIYIIGNFFMYYSGYLADLSSTYPPTTND